MAEDRPRKDPRRRRSKPVPISEFLKRWTQSRPSGARGDWQQVWNSVAEEPLNQYSRPITVKARCLLIEVDSSVLLQELKMFRKPELLKAVQQRVPGKIDDLEFRLSSKPIDK